jgi:hypothetical protein
MTSDSTVLYICIRQHTSSSVANDPNGSPTADGSTAWTTAPPTLTLALPDDSTLLYPYADTEALWKCAEKM